MKKRLFSVFILCAVIILLCGANTLPVETPQSHNDEEPSGPVYDMRTATMPDNPREVFCVMNINASLVYEKQGYFTQGMCVSDEYIYIAAAEQDGNDYRIRKIDRNTLNVIDESDIFYNHANGMTYNENTNELVVTALDGRSGLYRVSGAQDYSLFVCNASTLGIERVVNLEDIIKGISPDLLGISEIAYNSEKRQYFISTHHPNRYLIVLNEDFSLDSYIFIEEHNEEKGLYGDMTCDGDYIYFCRWVKEKDQMLNAIDRYTYDGEYTGSCYLFGVSHIESIEMGEDGYCYANFIDFSYTRDLELYRFRLEDAYVRLCGAGI